MASIATKILLASMIAVASAQTCLAFADARARSSIFAPSGLDLAPLHRNGPHLPSSFSHRPKQSDRPRSLTRVHSYRKFHEYAWNKLLQDNDAELDTVPEELKSNTSPAKGAPPGTNIVANIRSISQFPFLDLDRKSTNDRQVLRLARSAFLETQSPTSEALITPMTVHVLNFVLFPSPFIRDGIQNDDENGGYLGLPIFGADIVSLPGNKHLVALDFQPVLSLNDGVGSDGKGKTSLLPERYSHLESKLKSIHSKYQKSNSDSTPLLAWGGDIPPQAERFFSPYALWTRLGDENAIDTVNTVVWEAFREYADLYLELMSAVQNDINAGELEVGAAQEVGTDGNNPVLKGQIDYLEYRRTNDPARPMLQRLYGNEWSESVIGDVLFPGL
eukprot:CAMPEP_0172313218 /NCGR_PEP_ID=MMETSP1058-20130122/19710_1 /TAXON_ID=83371 /ORGANISM="Detonula confervacea, Strain CCMP 353" /LENGTH=388 /DNA_ID=CAMNT_0013026833 /DNA_START=85 /DNA_END=1251 /DNA_ORIENTATION=-